MTTQLFLAADRGSSSTHWLESYHTFSFAQYWDDQKVQFGPLRVLNDDVIAPQSGFPEHPHANMEIITLVMQGEITHRDSANHLDVTKAGEIQVMTAGAGITHSEINYHEKAPCHLFQIWIQPDTQGLEPSYTKFPISYGDNVLQEVIGPTAPQQIHQDCSMLLGAFTSPEVHTYRLTRTGAFLFVLQGSVRVEEQQIETGGGIAFTETDTIQFAATSKLTKILLFDLHV